MNKNNEWLITLNVRKKEDENQDVEVYHNLEQQIEIFLKEKLGNCEFVEKSRNNENYTVRFKVSSNVRPDQKDLVIKPICIDNELWEVNMQDINKFKEINFAQLLNDLYDHYAENRNPFDYLSSKLVGEAIKCYAEGLYDAVVILCRSVIDSSTYLACVWARNESNKETYEYRVPKPFEPGDEVDWGKLKKKTIELGILLKKAFKNIEKVRDYGNFAAHIGERQLKEMTEWSKKNRALIRDVLQKGVKGLNMSPRGYPKGYKLYTSKNEAYYALDMTVDFLKKLSAGYNQSN